MPRPERRSEQIEPRLTRANIEKNSLETNFFSNLLEHDPEKACPGLGPIGVKIGIVLRNRL